MYFKCYHYDIARGAYLTTNTFKKALRHAADSGFSHFLPYIENMIKLPSFEKACPDCAYTPEQWKTFDQVAVEYGIELIPHFNVIGHSTDACAAYPELAGKKGGLDLDVQSDFAKKWTKQCLEEYCSFSSGKHFLIGGDEWQPPNHLLTNPNFSIAKTWTDHINFAIDILKQFGRTPIVWHDILLHYPETLELLSKDAVIAFWFYDEDSNYPTIDMFHSKGFRTIMTSGICNGNLSQRRVNAIKNAVESTKRYNPYGIMVTSWSDCRWEKQQLNINLCGKLLNEKNIPDSIIETISRIELLEGIGQIHPAKEDILAECMNHINSGAFDQFPDYKQYLLNILTRNTDAEIESYLKHHYQEGSLYNSIKTASAHTEISMAELNILKKPIFSISTSKKSFGTTINIKNSDESFVIYPEYGASIQNYKKGTRQIIDHSLLRFIENNTYEPGGYRSYSGVGGLRPIWSFGSHHNPCILWQTPFKWSIDESKDAELRIELSKELYHVNITYTIIVKKGESGFTLIAEAVNKLDNIYGMFSFNLPLTVTPDTLTNLCFEWDHAKPLNFSEIRNNFIVIPAKQFLTVHNNGLNLTIKSNPDQTAGYYTDITPTCITPDLRGYYKKLNGGDKYSTTWIFTVET